MLIVVHTYDIPKLIGLILCIQYTTQTVLSQNADGTVSLIQVDPNNPIITLPDGTTAQVQGVATVSPF